MLASRRWRDWNPPAILPESTERKLTKPTKPRPSPILSVLSGGTLPISKRFKLSDSIPSQDPAQWREPFVRWLDAACVVSPRCFGGFGCLHIAFCEWDAGRGGLPCSRET